MGDWPKYVPGEKVLLGDTECVVVNAYRDWGVWKYDLRVTASELQLSPCLEKKEDNYE